MIKHKVTDFPASTMDIFPTIADIIGLSKSEMIFPIDGISLLPLFNSNIDKREVHIPFRFNNTGALIDNDFKLVATSLNEMQFELYDLEIDPKESNNIATANPYLFEKLKDKYLEWNLSVNNSVNGKDYPENMVLEQPKPHFWMQDARYEPYLKEFSKRPEYENRIKRGY